MNYKIVSYKIVNYKIVSYKIVSYKIVSYKIVSYKIVSWIQTSDVVGSNLWKWQFQFPRSDWSVSVVFPPNKNSWSPHVDSTACSIPYNTKG